MEFDKRCAVGYVVLSIVFPLLAEGMNAIGAAWSGNPAWVLISTIRNIFIGSWVLLLLVALVQLALEGRQARKDAREKEKAEKRAEELRIKNEIAHQRQWIELEKRRLKELEEALKRKEEARLEFWNEKWRELEAKQTRTSEEAVDQAIQDFG